VCHDEQEDSARHQCRLSSKFGAPPSHWPILLAEAKTYGLEVAGVSFHVGSGCQDATRNKIALRDCKFEMAKTDYGFNTYDDLGHWRRLSGGDAQLAEVRLLYDHD
jgi:diaminopimelate decarboxylase